MIVLLVSWNTTSSSYGNHNYSTDARGGIGGGGSASESSKERETLRDSFKLMSTGNSPVENKGN